MKNLLLLLLLPILSLQANSSYHNTAKDKSATPVYKRDIREHAQSYMNQPSLYESSVFFSAPRKGAKILLSVYNLRGEILWSYEGVTHKSGVSQIVSHKRLSNDVHIFRLTVDGVSTVSRTSFVKNPFFKAVKPLQNKPNTVSNRATFNKDWENSEV